jgi:hypothetical protein
MLEFNFEIIDRNIFSIIVQVDIIIFGKFHYLEEIQIFKL